MIRISVIQAGLNGSVIERSDFKQLGPNQKFGFQTVGTKPNKKVWISDSWDQTEQKYLDFRQMGLHRTKPNLT